MGGRTLSGVPSDEWMQRAVKFLAPRDRTVAQVEQFLRSKGASPNQVTQTIHRLSDLRYLSDHVYAQRWVDHRLCTRPMGPERLKAELQAKGISDSVASRVVADAFRTVTEEALAHRLVEDKQRQGRRLTLAQMVRLLRQRGFNEESIEHMIGAFETHKDVIHVE